MRGRHLRPIPIPPRPADTPWRVGTTFPPFTDEEFAYLAPSRFLYRVSPNDGARTVLDHGEDVLLLLNDANTPIDTFDAEVYRPFFESVWAIELGNELNLEYKREPRVVNDFYHDATFELRDAGYTGTIITAGIMNLNDDTLRWCQKTLDGLPGDLVCGWHGYDNFREPGQIEKLLGILDARRHAMTESGYGLEDWVACAREMEAGARLVFDSGALCYVHYQTHDGVPGTDLSTFGLRTYDGVWKQPLIDVLHEAAGWTV